MIKEILGYEGRYSIDEYGNVFNIKRNKPKLANISKSTGYLKTALSDCGRIVSTHLIHRLVAINFIPNPHNKREVNHKDGNKQNNHVSNLEWATPSENINHAFANGLMKVAKGENCYAALLTNNLVLEIFNSTLSNKELSNKYKVDICVIYQIKNGQNWSSVTGKKYKAKTSRKPKELLLKIFSEVGTNSEVGKKYHIPTKEVWRIRNSKTFDKL